METANFLAELWGFSFAIISLAFLMRPMYIEYFFQLVEDAKTILIFGIINIVLGVALVLTYNVWDSSWKVIITILGWLVITRGAVLLFLPNAITNIIFRIRDKNNLFLILCVVCVIVGCFLIFMGFTH